MKPAIKFVVSATLGLTLKLYLKRLTHCSQRIPTNIEFKLTKYPPNN